MTRWTSRARAASSTLTSPITLTWMLSAGLAAETAPTNAAACTTWVTWCFLIAWRRRGMSRMSPGSKSILSMMSGMRLSSRCRANTTGRCPSLTNLRLVSAPMTPIPPVMRTFIAGSFDLGTDRVDQPGPVLEVAFDECAELRRRKIDALEAVRGEEFARLRQVERLRHIRVDLVDQLGGHVGRAPHCEPDRSRKARNVGFRDRRQIGPRAQPVHGRRGENFHLACLLVRLDARQIQQEHRHIARQKPVQSRRRAAIGNVHDIVCRLLLEKKNNK